MDKSSQNQTDKNQIAWNANRYETWISAYGTPSEEAAQIVKDPDHYIRRLSPYIGTVAGKRICNVQGSHGRIAVALSLLGADVQVIDFADENRRFALDLAKEAGVSIRYSVCDIMNAGSLNLDHQFDTLVLELGILHYHQDILGFFKVLRSLAAENGTLILSEFHPAQRKLFWHSGPKDYFYRDMIEADVPNSDASAPSLGTCLYRFWTLGEIITAAIGAGFVIERLDEHPDWADPKVPGAFTLCAHV